MESIASSGIRANAKIPPVAMKKHAGGMMLVLRSVLSVSAQGIIGVCYDYIEGVTETLRNLAMVDGKTYLIRHARSLPCF